MQHPQDKTTHPTVICKFKYNTKWQLTLTVVFIIQKRVLIWVYWFSKKPQFLDRFGFTHNAKPCRCECQCVSSFLNTSSSSQLLCTIHNIVYWYNITFIRKKKSPFPPPFFTSFLSGSPQLPPLAWPVSSWHVEIQLLILLDWLVDIMP